MKITGIRIRDSKKQFDVELDNGKEVLVEAKSEAEALDKAAAGKVVKESKIKGGKKGKR